MFNILCPKCNKNYIHFRYAKQCRECWKENYIIWNKGKKLHYEIWNKGKIMPWRGKRLSSEMKLKIKQAMSKIDCSHPPGRIEKIRQARQLQIKNGETIGENHHQWKGNNVGYVYLHDWIRKKLGKPFKCESCGKDNLKKHQIHWANKSRNYLRDLNDWIRLCVKCHSAYDRNQLILPSK